MLDAMHAAATPHLIRREDYRPPDWLVPEIRLDFDLGLQTTSVRSWLRVERNGAHDRPLRLDGDGLTPLVVRIDGEETAEWAMDGGTLLIPMTADAALIETEVELAPVANTQLSGLYASGALLCTQCEAEGFRRITFFPDRPDVLSRYTVRLAGDRLAFPVLLSNGDLTASGEGVDGNHFAEWTDPFLKPSYLFALVAGDLAASRDSFTTMSGKQVELAIWAKADELPRTAHAMDALKKSMAWDERVYGREYDLAQFNIVAVEDFNAGAMENKGLNIFNARYIMADPETATDLDYDGVAGVVAHEYFHNWSGNRVTCRDWFQLSLKEGFTVFRDQCFSAELGSEAVKRIEDVRLLRAAQFQEDAGPLAHPIRPESYLEIGNFYTATVYNKGAEIIRMMHTIAGAERFRRGTDLYFDRHDGEAATCEDFVCAMEEGAGLDLTQFRLWYATAGTPRIAARIVGATLIVEQAVPDTPGQTNKPPMAIPLRYALFDRATGHHRGEQMQLLTEARTDIAIGGGPRPVLSINRGFAAPIIVETDLTAADLAFLAAHDDDPFGRYEAIQQLMVGTLTAEIAHAAADPAPMLAAIEAMLGDTALDPAFVAEAVLLPTEAYLGDQMLVVVPEAIHAVRERTRRTIGQSFADQWQALYERNAGCDFEYSPSAKAARRIRNVALGYLAAADPAAAAALAFAQFRDCDNMTDTMAALGTLANGNSEERIAALDIFYNRHRANPLVLDKWFSVQALSLRDDTLETVRELLGHSDFTLANPNRVRSLVGAFGVNQAQFHRADGAGYALYTDTIVALDPLNASTAAKFVPPLGRWARFDEKRQAMMKAQLERLIATPGISKDVFEQASKSLVAI